MIDFTFNEEVAKKNQEENSFENLPEGTYLVRIKEAIEQTSKTGKPQIKLTMELVDHNNRLMWHYFTVVQEDWFQRQVLEFYDCFNLPHEAKLNTMSWIGKVGKVATKNDEYGMKVKRFIKAEKPTTTEEDKKELPF